MRAIRKHILLIKLIYEQARLRLPKISMTFLLKKSKRVSCAAHYEPCEERAGPCIPKDCAQFMGGCCLYEQ